MAKKITIVLLNVLIRELADMAELVGKGMFYGAGGCLGITAMLMFLEWLTS